LSENQLVKYCLPIIALLALATPPLHAADGLSGAWTADRGQAVQTFVFKAQSDDRFGGIVCGPCDDPLAVFRIEDGRMNSDSQITFFIAYDRPAHSLRSQGPLIPGARRGAGRNTQQNFILKIRDNKVWGLICGPCTPEGIFLIDDGFVDGNHVTFYINHLDTPPSARKTGVNRNVMRGTLTGNVMKFTWVREGAEDQPGGEMTLIGPIR
jgi:hypothetical protein